MYIPLQSEFLMFKNTYYFNYTLRIDNHKDVHNRRSQMSYLLITPSRFTATLSPT